MQANTKLLVLTVALASNPAWAQVAQNPKSKGQQMAVVGADAATEIAPLELSELKPATEAKVRELIPQLGAADPSVRQEARRELMELGPVGYVPLREEYVATEDFEVLLQIEEIVHATYVDYHVYSQKGFLGVGIFQYRPDPDDGVPLPKDADAVRLTTIHDGSAADRAGLLQKDVVIAMNGTPLEPEEAEDPTADVRRRRDPLVRHFSQRIASHRPFETITLTIYRGAELKKVEVTLGKPPADLVRSGRIQVVNESLVEAEKRFIDWWTYHFAQPRANAL